MSCEEAALDVETLDDERLDITDELLIEVDVLLDEADALLDEVDVLFIEVDEILDDRLLSNELDEYADDSLEE